MAIFDGANWIDTEPGDWIHVPEGGTHYLPVSWDQAYAIIVRHLKDLDSPNEANCYRFAIRERPHLKLAVTAPVSSAT